MSGTAVAPWKPATLWLLFLGPFFFLTYGLANWAASLQHGLPSLFLSWERGIPFLPWMIVPYLSMDILFAGALFLCRDEREIRVHAARIVFATVLSVSIFLLYPMQYGIDRPATVGFYGPMFDLLYVFDGPFNQAPSLHISLAVIVWTVYARRGAGLLRRIIDIWFLLVAASVLFTWQHHLIDIAAGVLVGYAALRLFPNSAARGSVRRHRRVAMRYAMLTVVLWLGAFAMQPAAPVLLWAAVSTGVVAAAYAGLGPAVFGKSAGRRGIFISLLLAPYFAGAGLGYRWFSRVSEPWSEIAPGVLLGRVARESEARRLVDEGVAAVLDLTVEYRETEAFLRLPYLNLAVLDLTAPSVDQLARGAAFIERQLDSGAVYVHCALGYSRGAAVVAAWLLMSGRAASVAEAEAMIRRKRSSILLTGRSLAALENFQRYFFACPDSSQGHIFGVETGAARKEFSPGG